MTAATTDRPPTSAATTPGVFGRRRSRMTMVGVLLAIVGGLVAWFAYAQATQGVEVDRHRPAYRVRRADHRG